MERDWELIRELLTDVERRCSLPNDRLRLEDYAEERRAAVAYHMELLILRGLVKGIVSQRISGAGPRAFQAWKLTWEGHEFLDSIRNDTVWARTKKHFHDQGVPMTFDLVKAISKEAASAVLRAAMGG